MGTLSLYARASAIVSHEVQIVTPPLNFRENGAGRLFALCSRKSEATLRRVPRRQRKRERAATFVLAMAAASGLAVACGSRTGLLVPDETDAAIDAGHDALMRKDATKDVREEDVIPPIDAFKPDAYKNDCPDASATLVYVVSEAYDLLSFYPPTATFTSIGKLSCPASSGSATPFSMAVDRKGTAYVVYNDGELFKVSTANASCTATSYMPNQLGIQTFGMGFATVGAGPAEQLFVATDQGGARLANIDVMTYSLSIIDYIQPAIAQAELTGTGDGRLFAFYSTGSGSAIGELDKATAKVLGIDLIPSVTQGQGWAFAFWGGDFYLFTGPGGTQQTYQYDPMTKTATLVASYTSLIVGAGVSTCAPQ